jgi:molybdenum cofactor guanylyltransferase
MGRDKAALPVTGPAGPTTMLERVVSVVAARCAPVLVVAAPGQYLPETDATVLRDRVQSQGPLVATGRGLRAAAEAGHSHAFVCAVDMPNLTADLIDTLTGPAHRLGVDVVLPWDGRDHYLAGVYRTALWSTIDELAASGARSMRALIDVVDVQRLVMPEQPALVNVNSADDLASISPPRLV